MIRKLFLGIVMLLFTVANTGCSFLKEPVTTAPQLLNSQQEVKIALEAILSPTAMLKNPRLGENKSAIQFVDMDGDKQNEVIVFYYIAGNEKPLRYLILKKINGKWQPKKEIKINGDDIYKVICKDVTGDGRPELLVCIEGQAQQEKKQVVVYQLMDDIIKEIFKNTTDEVTEADMDGDGIAEIVLVDLNKETEEANATLYKYQENKLKVISEARLDGSVNDYIGITPGKANSVQQGIFIDGEIGAHYGFTELLVLENGKLRDAFINKEGYVEKTLKNSFIASQDIDQDGIVEIATTREPIGYEDVPISEIPWITTWNKWNGKDDLVFACESYNNLEGGYAFRFPKRWGQEVTIQISKPKEKINKATFIYQDINTSQNFPLFTISVYTTAQWEALNNRTQRKKANEFELCRSLNKVYVVTSEKPTTMSITLEEIKNGFMLN